MRISEIKGLLAGALEVPDDRSKLGRRLFVLKSERISSRRNSAKILDTLIISEVLKNIWDEFIITLKIKGRRLDARVQSRDIDLLINKVTRYFAFSNRYPEFKEEVAKVRQRFFRAIDSIVERI